MPVNPYALISHMLLVKQIREQFHKALHYYDVKEG